MTQRPALFRSAAPVQLPWLAEGYKLSGSDVNGGGGGGSHLNWSQTCVLWFIGDRYSRRCSHLYELLRELLAAKFECARIYYATEYSLAKFCLTVTFKSSWILDYGDDSWVIIPIFWQPSSRAIQNIADMLGYLKYFLSSLTAVKISIFAKFGEIEQCFWGQNLRCHPTKG